MLARQRAGQGVTGMRPLDDATHAWVLQQESAMRRSAAEAIAASNRWREINAALTAKFEAEQRDQFSIAKAKAASLELADAYGSYQFHAGKAQFHAAMLQGAAAARELLAAGDDDQGLLYTRYDDAPTQPVPVPDGVEGFSVTGRSPRPGANSSPAGRPSPNERRAHRSGRPGVMRGEAGVGAPASPTRGGAR